MFNLKFNESHASSNIANAQANRDSTLLDGNIFSYICAEERLSQVSHHKEQGLVKKKTTKYCMFKRNIVYCGNNVINVFLYSLDTKRVLSVDLYSTWRDVCILYQLPMHTFWYQINSRVIDLNRRLIDYDIQNNMSVIANMRILGGESLELPLYTHVRDCELAIMQSFSLQSEDIPLLTQGDTDAFVNNILTTFQRANAIVGKENPWILTLFENFLQIVYWLRKCESKLDYVMCTGLAFKLLTGRGVTSTFWNYFRVNDLQDDAFTTGLRKARDLYTASSALINDPIVSKIKQIYTYLLVQGILKQFGQQMSLEEFQKLDSKTKVSAKNSVSLIMLIIETALTICERLDTYRTTGDWVTLVHGEASYVKWLKEADRLINLAPFTSNLIPHNTTYFSFISDLNDTVEKGEALCKYINKSLHVDSVGLRKKLQSLQLIKNTEVTRRASQRERRAPFGVLIHGGSSVAKSTFTKMLFYYYGQLHGLDTSDHYRYVRNPADEYWSNFDSSKWCIQMDDIAFLLASKCSDTDPTLKEMLNVVNNVPYVPPQAALEDKGKTPVMAKIVLATTNTPDLNAQDYFSCPLAVRRRLPYVVQVKPKPEYMHENGRFIDPTKLQVSPGQFPDFWEITVQKLVPVDYHKRDSAKLEDVVTFTNVHDFLKHFAKASLDHEKTQNSSDTCDTQMKALRVCKLCYSVGDSWSCLQSLALVPTCTYYLLSYFLQYFIRCVLDISLTCVISWCYRFTIARFIFSYLATCLDTEYEVRFLGRMSLLGGSHFRISIRKCVKAGFFLISLLTVIKVTQAVTQPSHTNTCRCDKKKDTRKTCDTHTDKSDGKTEDETLVEEVSRNKPVTESTTTKTSVSQSISTPDAHKMTLQGNRVGTTELDLEKEEKTNVWYNPTLQLNQFDVPVPSRSLAALTPAEIRDLFQNNCVKLDIHSLDVPYQGRTCAVFLKGQYLCANRHAFNKGSRYRITVLEASNTQGLNSNSVHYISRNEMNESIEKDVVVFSLRNIPPRKDILKYWNTCQIPVTHMLSVTRNLGGTTTYNEIFNVNFCESFPVEALNIEMPMYMGVGTQDTQKGDCGSIGVALTPRGPVILGLHTLGYKRTIGFPHITRTELEALCYETCPIVEGGGEPALSLNGETVLDVPHHKSLFRYVQDGTANIYGTLTGFRAKPKSKVCATPLKREMLEFFKCEDNYGQPTLQGWEPWRNNVIEMLNPQTNVDQTLLSECVASFTRDIILGLDATVPDWRGQLVFLSDRAAVNGLPGVKFIDRINCNSSMGHPWNKSKGNFLIEAADEMYPEGIDFTSEVWDRVRQIENNYDNGKRAYPVYTGHLKDEVLPKKKIEAKKVRMFTGAPIDVSLVIRKKLLSFVRLVQKNKFVFEAAPGTAAQSTEWTHIYNYLVAHGTDQMVAGDYGKFDKHMIATFILSAYEIIVNIHKEAGFNERELRSIMCIGYDTAFPVVNVNGDLIEFFGTNPSGHPLTVIINSLVNSLYMRYAYCMTNPIGQYCDEFKANVNLMTYGDDNIMGVSKLVPWFNHTSIQEALRSIGVEYTMADKETESVPYISIDECSFLKRSWRYEPELEAYACPLEVASIHKSLTMWVPSDTLDKYSQMVRVITSANNEFFFHGREVFETNHKFFKEILKKMPYQLYVDETTLPDWDALCERFRRASEGN